MSANEQDLHVGIDLGTSNSVISYWDVVGEKPLAFETDFGVHIMPSVVSWDERDQKWVVGSPALTRREVQPDVTVSAIKRHMSEDYKTPTIGGKQWTPVEISRILLERLAWYAEGPPRGNGPIPASRIRHAVICHPYDFDQEAKKRTLEAARAALADLDEANLSLIEEPTAAALGYGLFHDLKDGETVLVFDLGGGTFDITVFRASVNAEKELTLQVMALDGDEKLGGEDFDKVVMDFLAAKWKESGFSADLTKDTAPIRRLRQYLKKTAEDTKIFLTEAESYSVLLQDPLDPFAETLTLEVTLAQFNALSEELFDRIEATCERALKSAEAQGLKGPVDHVLLVGGSTNMPRVKALVKQVFGKLPSAPYDRATIVSKGAALYAATRGGLLEGIAFKTLPFKRVKVENILAHPIGLQARLGGRQVFKQIFAKGTRFPTTSEPVALRLDGSSPQETLCIWEARTSDNVNFLGIQDVVDKHKGIEIGKVTFNGTSGEPRKVTITFDVLNDGILTGKYTDPATKEVQSFEIGRFATSKHEV